MFLSRVGDTKFALFTVEIADLWAKPSLTGWNLLQALTIPNSKL